MNNILNGLGCLNFEKIVFSILNYLYIKNNEATLDIARSESN